MERSVAADLNAGLVRHIQKKPIPDDARGFATIPKGLENQPVPSTVGACGKLGAKIAFLTSIDTGRYLLDIRR